MLSLCWLYTGTHLFKERERERERERAITTVELQDSAPLYVTYCCDISHGPGNDAWLQPELSPPAKNIWREVKAREREREMGGSVYLWAPLHELARWEEKVGRMRALLISWLSGNVFIDFHPGKTEPRSAVTWATTGWAELRGREMQSFTWLYSIQCTICIYTEPVSLDALGKPLWLSLNQHLKKKIVRKVHKLTYVAYLPIYESVDSLQMFARIPLFKFKKRAQDWALLSVCGTVREVNPAEIITRIFVQAHKALHLYCI